MLKILLFVVLATAIADVPEENYRFFATTRTSTLVVLSTTTAPSSVKRTCWNSPAGPSLTPCRRRRGIAEQPEISGLDVPLTELLQPSQVLPLEPTQNVFLAEIPQRIAEISDINLESSAELEIDGPVNCLGRSALGITILYTTSTTVVITARTETTVGSVTYQLAACFPKILANSQC